MSSSSRPTISDDEEPFIHNSELHITVAHDTSNNNPFCTAMQELNTIRNMHPSLDWSLMEFAAVDWPSARLRYASSSGDLSAGILRVLCLAGSGGLLQSWPLGLFHDTAGVLLDGWLHGQVALLSRPTQVRDFLRAARLALWPDHIVPKPPDLPLSLLSKALEEALVEFFPVWLVIILGRESLRMAFRRAIEALSDKRFNEGLVLRIFLRLLAEIIPELKTVNITDL